MELVPAINNISIRAFVRSEYQKHHLLKRNTPSELGCSLSHLLAVYRAYRHCTSHGLEMAIVIEDDVRSEMLQHWTRSLHEMVDELPSNWAVVQLQLIAQQSEWEALVKGWRQQPQLAILQDRTRHFGTGAYLIHLRGMRQLLHHFMPPELPAGAAVFAAHDLRALATARGQDPLSFSGKSVEQALQIMSGETTALSDSGEDAEQLEAVRWGVWSLGESLRRGERQWSRYRLSGDAYKLFAPYKDTELTDIAQPARNGYIEVSEEMPEVMAEALRSLRVPKYVDEMRADNDLVYKMAGPVYLATPPLLTCVPTSTANSSIEHISTQRLARRGATEENDKAHSNSPVAAAAWAAEAAELSRREVAQRRRPSARPVAEPRRIDVPTRWAHFACLPLRVFAPPTVAATQLHLLLAWLEGDAFAVVLHRASLGTRVARPFALILAQPAGEAYPTYELRPLSARQTETPAAEASLVAHILSEASSPRDLDANQPPGADAEPARQQVRSSGGKRLPLTRGNFARLAFRVIYPHQPGKMVAPEPPRLQLWAEGMLVEERPWPAASVGDLRTQHVVVGAVPSLPSRASPASRPDLVASVHAPPTTKLLHAAHVCAEEAATTGKASATASASSTPGGASTASAPTCSAFHVRSECGGSTQNFAPPSHPRQPVLASSLRMLIDGNVDGASGAVGGGSAAAAPSASAPASASGTAAGASMQTASASASEAADADWISPILATDPWQARLLPVWQLRGATGANATNTSSAHMGVTLLADSSAAYTAGATSNSTRKLMQPLADSDLTLPWRETLQLPVTSTPLLLPVSRSLRQSRYVRRAHSRCNNEIRLSVSASSFANGTEEGAEIGTLLPANASRLARCAAFCTSQPACMGFRIDRRKPKKSPKRLSRSACVLLRGVRSKEPDDCRLKHATRNPGSITLLLRQMHRRMRKPFIELVPFEVGDKLQVLGWRTQASRVPTKILFSHVTPPSHPMDRQQQSDSGAGAVAAKMWREARPYFGVFIHWSRRRAWASSFEADDEYDVTSAALLRQGREVLLQAGANFSLKLGEKFQIVVRRTPRGIVVELGGGPEVLVEATPGSAAVKAEPLINQVSVQGTFVEHAIVDFATAKWQPFPGLTCINEVTAGPAVMIEHTRSREVALRACRDACIARGAECVSAVLDLTPAADRGQPGSQSPFGTCRLITAFKMRTLISTCEQVRSPSWDLHMRLTSPPRWYNPAVALDVAPSSTPPALRCLLRESSYSHCTNPSFLTKRDNEAMMDNLFGAFWTGWCRQTAETGPTRGAIHVEGMRRLQLDPSLHRLGLVPQLSTEDAVLVAFHGRMFALASVINVQSWDLSARRASQKRWPLLIDLERPQNATALRCDFGFGYWEKNWMPFELGGRLFAVRWFSPHVVLEIFPDLGTCREVHRTEHSFGGSAELHGGAPPVRFDANYFLGLVRLRTGGWTRTNHETRDYANYLYLFKARPPFEVVRMSMPFTLPSCVQRRLNMRIQVVKSLVPTAGGFLLCWGELDCYSCCATLPIRMLHSLLQF